MESSEIMDFKDAQAFLGVSRSTLLRWIRDGRVSGYKAGRKWKFYREDLGHMLLKEPQAVYSTGSFSVLQEELRTLGLVDDKMDAGSLKGSFWCEWQDREGWLWLSCTPFSTGYELSLKPADPGAQSGSWPLTTVAARQMIQAWQAWSSESTAVPARPGRVRCMQGAAGGEDVSLYLTRHSDTLAPFEKWFADTTMYSRCRELMKGFPQDWLITGPPRSTTAYAAYALALKIAECNPGMLERVSTCETDHTCFWPGAIHVYPERTYEPCGVDACIQQLAVCSDYPARGIRSARVRIGYSFSDCSGTGPPASAYHLQVRNSGGDAYFLELV